MKNSKEDNKITDGIMFGNQYMDPDDEYWLKSSNSSEDDGDVYKKGDIQDHPIIRDKIYECKTFAGYKITEAYEGDKIKKGQRVVLNPEYENEKKDCIGRYCVGTVVKVRDDRVHVLWDSEEESESYKVQDMLGDRVIHTLLLLDNAQTGAMHDIYKCDECKQKPIRGIKWRCLVCKDYDLCTRCYMLDKHNRHHPFSRKLDNNSRSVRVGVRSMDKNYKLVYGIFQGAKVTLRKGSGATGKVIALKDEKSHLFNCDALVKWKDGNSEEMLRVGREGKVDLQCVTPAKGLTYYEEHLPIVTEENAKPGMRVVAKCGGEKGEAYVGTVISIEDTLMDLQKEDGEELKTSKTFLTRLLSNSSNKAKGPIDLRPTVQRAPVLAIQWDNEEKTDYFCESQTIFLYDNSQIGVEHETNCDECGRNIIGLRWKAIEKKYDLCNGCYMSDKGDMLLRFYRMADSNVSERMTLSRSALPPKNKVQALGLFKGAEVRKFGSSIKGTISKVTDYKVNVGRTLASVEWTENSTYLSSKLTDLRCLKLFPTFGYYPAHLPYLQDGMNGYIKAGDGKTKISIDHWTDEGNKVQLKEAKSTLYLMFACNSDTESKIRQTLSKTEMRGRKSKRLSNIRRISKKTRLPCLDIVDKTLFYQGKVIIHQKTSKETVQILISMGECALARGDSRDRENEIDYFQRMIEAHCGNAVLPVILSIGNGGFREQIIESAVTKSIPIVSIKKFKKEATVTLIDFYMDQTDDEEHTPPLLATEYIFDANIPWKVKREYEARLFYNRRSQLGDDVYEISSTDDVQNDLRDFDAFMCCMIISVCMEERTSKTIKDIYPNHLLVYLLKTGKWKIPKDAIKDFFDHHSIEYVFERKMCHEFKKGLWEDLQKSTKNAYVPPVWKDDKLKISVSGLFGLVFLALLKGKFYTGAKQFVETGCVRIQFILIGCVILQEAIDDWRINASEREKLQIMIKEFTHQTIRVLHCIYENDKQNQAMLQGDGKRQTGNEENNTKEPKVAILHSGRLLLNHGYLTDGIRTQNKEFLDNEVVERILNQMWHGREKITVQGVFGFVLLTLFHVILLPPLMITMQHKPLHWLYKQYEIPSMKVTLNVLSLCALMMGYAYMLLFDFEAGITTIDKFLLVLISSFFIDEMIQLIVAIMRRKKLQYFSDPWNYVDWFSMITYACGMVVKKTGVGMDYYNAAKVLLVAAFTMMSIRILHMFTMSELLGPKLVMIRKMFVDTFALWAILIVITMCYNIAYFAILYSDDSEFTFHALEKIVGNGYWLLFDIDLDTENLREPECTFNKTVYRAGLKERCPSPMGAFLAPYLKAFYVFIAVVLLLNLLIAMYSYTFSEVHEKSKFYWSQIQTDFLEEYSVRSIFPVHMQIPATIVCIIQALVWVIMSKIRYGSAKCCNSEDDYNGRHDKTKFKHTPHIYEDDINTFNKSPMFVRVFIYDTNYDLKLRKTRKAEGHAALITKGDMDISEDDKITKLQRKLIKNQMKLQKNINGNIKKMQMMLRSELIRKTKSVQSLETIERPARESAIIFQQSRSESGSDGSILESESEDSLPGSVHTSRRESIISKQTLKDSDNEDAIAQSKERLKSWRLSNQRKSSPKSEQPQNEVHSSSEVKSESDM